MKRPLSAPWVFLSYFPKLFAKSGKARILKEFYDKHFSSELLNKLINIGCVTKNYYLINYLKYKDILR